MAFLKNIASGVLNIGERIKEGSSRFNPAEIVLRGLLDKDEIKQKSKQIIDAGLSESNSVGESIGIFQKGSVKEEEINRKEPSTMLDKMKDASGSDNDVFNNFMKQYTRKPQRPEVLEILDVDPQEMTDGQKKRKDIIKGIVDSIPETLIGTASTIATLKDFTIFGRRDQQMEELWKSTGIGKQDETFKDYLQRQKDPFEAQNEQQAIGHFIGDTIQMLVPGSALAKGIDKLGKANKLSKSSILAIEALGEVGLGVGFESAKEGEINKDTFKIGVATGLASMGIGRAFNFILKKIGKSGVKAIKELQDAAKAEGITRESINKISQFSDPKETIDLNKIINPAEIKKPSIIDNIETQNIVAKGEEVIPKSFVPETIKDVPVLSREDVFNIEDIYPNSKSIKKRIEIETGIKNKPTAIFEGDDIIEFGSKDIAKFYRSIEKERASEVRSQFKDLVDRARKEKLGSVIDVEKREMIGNKRLEEVTDEELKLLNSKLEVLLADKKKLLQMRLDAKLDDTPIKTIKRFLNRTFKNARQLAPKVAKKFDNADNAARIATVSDKRAISSIFEMSNEDALIFKELIESDNIGSSMKLNQALREWNVLSADIYKRANDVGVEMGRVKNYFPRYVKEEFIDGIHSRKTAKKAVDLLMKNGMSKSRAQQIWGEYKATVFKNRKSSHLEMSRTVELPKEFYETDPRIVLPKYIREANVRISDITHLGNKDELVLDVIKQLEKDGDIDAAIEAFHQYESMVTKFGSNSISKVLGTWHSLKLSLAAITNFSEISFTAARTNPYIAFKNAILATTKKGIKKAEGFGDLGSMERYMNKQFGEGSKASDKILESFQFFKTQEWADRVKALSGIDYAENLLEDLKKRPNNSFLRRRIEGMGLDPDKLIKDGIDDIDRAIAANTSLAANMPVNRADLPSYWKHPVGREVFRFKSFAYKATGFMYKEVLQEAVKYGNIKPMIYFLAVGTLMGEVTIDLKDLIKKGEVRELPNSFDEYSKRVIDNLMAVGSFGLVNDFFNSVKFGRWSGYLSSFLGPTASDIEGFMRAAFNDVEDPIQTGKNLTDFFASKTLTSGYTRFKNELKRRDVLNNINKKASNEKISIDERDKYKEALQKMIDNGDIKKDEAIKKLKDLDIKQEKIGKINIAVDFIKDKDMDKETIFKYLKHLRNNKAFTKAMLRKVAEEYLKDKEIDSLIDSLK